MTAGDKRRSSGRPLKFGADELKIVRELALANPAAPIVELTRKFNEQTGLGVNRWMMSKSLARAGVKRVRRVKRVATAKPQKDPHRFTDEHRVEGPAPCVRVVAAST